MYKQLKKMRQEEGFTLIELLIVIIILGVLAAIVVFSVSGITNKGSSAACSGRCRDRDGRGRGVLRQADRNGFVHATDMAALPGCWPDPQRAYFDVTYVSKRTRQRRRRSR